MHYLFSISLCILDLSMTFFSSRFINWLILSTRTVINNVVWPRKLFNYYILNFSKYSFIILLPRSRTGLSKLETRLKKCNLTKLSHDLVSRYELLVDVRIPKFKVEMAIELDDLLKKVSKHRFQMIVWFQMSSSSPFS